jgi:hypothetical protein
MFRSHYKPVVTRQSSGEARRAIQIQIQILVKFKVRSDCVSEVAVMSERAKTTIMDAK